LALVVKFNTGASAGHLIAFNTMETRPQAGAKRHERYAIRNWSSQVNSDAEDISSAAL
jgi:hypothetical protein